MYRFKKQILFTAALFLTLTACGGGGGGGGGDTVVTTTVTPNCALGTSTLGGCKL
jgi:hypothetical protein